MKLILAPMEGVIDADLRALLTAVGGYDACVSEFVRVSERPPPPRVLLRHCPELRQGGRTASGTPVILQLLGGDAHLLAESAASAAELGAPGIDLNFGCPSKTVNRRDGGAILLRSPARIQAIVAAVRAAVPAAVPVSAKLRLGFEDASLALDNAQAAASGGADLLTIHARTRADGYRAPARWEQLAAIRAALTIPLVANGDISSAARYAECRRVSGCADAMLGRGAVARPDLARQIRSAEQGEGSAPMEWDAVAALLCQLAQRMAHHAEPRWVMPRLKQWLNMLAPNYPEAAACFAAVRGEREPTRLLRLLTEAAYPGALAV